MAQLSSRWMFRNTLLFSGRSREQGRPHPAPASQQSGADVVKAAQERRKAREVSKQHDSAAISVQRVFRSYASRQRTRSACLTDLLASLPASDPSSPLSYSTLWRVHICLRHRLRADSPPAQETLAAEGLEPLIRRAVLSVSSETPIAVLATVLGMAVAANLLPSLDAVDHLSSSLGHWIFWAVLYGRHPLLEETCQRYPRDCLAVLMQHLPARLPPAMVSSGCLQECMSVILATPTAVLPAAVAHWLHQAVIAVHSSSPSVCMDFAGPLALLAFKKHAAAFENAEAFLLFWSCWIEVVFTVDRWASPSLPEQQRQNAVFSSLALWFPQGELFTTATSSGARPDVVHRMANMVLLLVLQLFQYAPDAMVAVSCGLGHPNESGAVQLTVGHNHWFSIFLDCCIALGLSRLIRLAFERNSRLLFFPQDQHSYISSLSSISAFPEKQSAVIRRLRSLSTVKSFRPSLTNAELARACVGFLVDEDTEPEAQRMDAEDSESADALHRFAIDAKFLVHFKERYRLFVKQELKMLDDNVSHVGYLRRAAYLTERVAIRVRRNWILEDALEALAEHRVPNLRHAYLIVEFVGEEGLGDGVRKEFFTTLTKELFRQDRGLFMTSSDGRYVFPHPEALALHGLDVVRGYFHFCGRIVAKCIVEGILLDVSFADFFIGKLIGYSPVIDDMAVLDPILYKNLMFLRLADDAALVRDMSLCFELAVAPRGAVELVQGGRTVDVTLENKDQYIRLVADYKLSGQFATASKAFCTGFFSVIPQEDLLLFFRHDELKRLVCGDEESTVDVDDWQQHCEYSRCAPRDPPVQQFWEVVRGLTQQQKALLLRFVTSTRRPPLFGFSELEPKFTVMLTDDVDHLPSASTCFNLLKLPKYSSVAKMRDFLIMAIEGTDSFSFS